MAYFKALVSWYNDVVGTQRVESWFGSNSTMEFESNSTMEFEAKIPNNFSCPSTLLSSDLQQKGNRKKWRVGGQTWWGRPPGVLQKLVVVDVVRGVERVTHDVVVIWCLVVLGLSPVYYLIQYSMAWIKTTQVSYSAATPSLTSFGLELASKSM